MEHKLHFDFSTVQLIIQKIGQIDRFKGAWQYLDKDENRYLQALRKIATLQSIGSSTRIEGNTLTDADIATLLKNLKVAKLATRDEQEVVGYYEVLELITTSYADIDLSIATIHTLHSLLLKYSIKDNRHRGKFKEISNRIVATYPDGTTRVIFNTTEPFLTEKEMQEAIMWLNNTLQTGTTHPLLIIATFIYEFLSIHPYQDGNGRLSRLLTNLLLLKLDYKFVLYVSLENSIEHKKKEYYAALMSGQKDRAADKERLDDWILFFLDTILDLIGKLEQKLKTYQQSGAYLNERQKEVLQYIQQHQPVKIGDLVNALPQYPKATLKKDVQYLVAAHQIERVGNYRATIYITKVQQ